MKETKKLELAQQLAKEFGMTGEKREKGSHFDRSTNTLFVGSKVYHYEDMESAKAFFEDNKVRMRERGDNASSYFEIGELAIKMMMEDSLGSGGRVIVKSE